MPFTIKFYNPFLSKDVTSVCILAFERYDLKYKEGGKVTGTFHCYTLILFCIHFTYRVKHEVDMANPDF